MILKPDCKLRVEDNYFLKCFKLVDFQLKNHRRLSQATPKGSQTPSLLVWPFRIAVASPRASATAAGQEPRPRDGFLGPGPKYKSLAYSGRKSPRPWELETGFRGVCSSKVERGRPALLQVNFGQTWMKFGWPLGPCLWQSGWNPWASLHKWIGKKIPVLWIGIIDSRVWSVMFNHDVVMFLWKGVELFLVRTGTPRCIALLRSLHSLQSEGLWQPCVEQASWWHFSNSICSLCHTLVILAIFQSFSLYLWWSWSVLIFWYYYYKKIMTC